VSGSRSQKATCSSVDIPRRPVVTHVGVVKYTRDNGEIVMR
jgi:hypothetical protein